MPRRPLGAVRLVSTVPFTLSVLKNRLQEELSSLLKNAAGSLPAGLPFDIVLAEPKNPDHGDFALNHAMIHAKSLGQNPRALADQISEVLRTHPDVATVEVAGPGFINLRIQPRTTASQVGVILGQGQKFGNSSPAQPRKIHVEYVSVNPNGPITIGSGRGAAYGDTLSRVLRAAGENVHSEYYINDALNSEQMRLFALSVQFYMKESAGEPAEFPEKGYKGDYVKAVAAGLEGKISPDAPLAEVQAAAQAQMIQCQREDLTEFRVEFDQWFSEQSLHDSGGVTRAIETLIQSGAADKEPWFEEAVHEGAETRIQRTEQEAGPIWLRSTRFGDEKDRVLVRSDGRPAYIAGDLAYMEDKLGQRSYDLSLLILGPDHHGYIGRMNAVTAALGFAPDRFRIIIYQLVRFLKDGKLAPMRKRDGNIYELKDLVHEVGVDAARCFYVMRSHDTPLDFDIDLASRLSDDNPVFYVQYAHARICSVLAKAKEAGFADAAWSDACADLLTDPRELALIRRIVELPEIVSRCAEDFQVHRIMTYASELARSFHSFYDGCRVVQTDQPELSKARICLAEAARTGLGRSLELIGVSAPEHMSREGSDGADR